MKQVVQRIAGGCYHVNAGDLARRHRYQEPRVARGLFRYAWHFVDTTQPLGDAPISTFTTAFGSAGELGPRDNFLICSGDSDSSLGVVSFGSGGSRHLPKQRIEAVGRGRSVVIDDFRSITCDGERYPAGADSRGHVGAARGFLRLGPLRTSRPLLSGRPRRARRRRQPIHPERRRNIGLTVRHVPRRR